MDSLARSALQAALDIPDVEPGGSTFSQSEEDDALWIDAKQIAHEKAPSVVEVRLTRPVMRAEKGSVMTDPRLAHLRKSSECVTLSLSDPDDFPFLHRVIALAAAAHRPAEGTVLLRPPTGADLARRRRFH